MIEVRRLAAALACAILCAAAASAKTTFLPVLEDIPLAPGQVAAVDETVVFEGAGGRVLAATARGPTAPSAILDWYRGALPPLGWRPLTPAGDRLSFTRGPEKLEIVVAAAPTGGSTVRFTLLAAPPSGTVSVR